MNSQEISCVQQSFPRVFAAKVDIANRFYERLFALRPDFQKLFSDEMHEQRQMFSTVLATVVRSLNDYPDYSASIQRIWESHRRFALSQQDLAVAEHALNHALAQESSARLNPDEQAAWAKAIAWLIKGMGGGAENAA